MSDIINEYISQAPHSAQCNMRVSGYVDSCDCGLKDLREYFTKNHISMDYKQAFEKLCDKHWCMDVDETGDYISTKTRAGFLGFCEAWAYALQNNSLDNQTIIESIISTLPDNQETRKFLYEVLDELRARGYLRSPVERQNENLGDTNDLEDLIRDAHDYADGVSGNSWGAMASMLQEILNRFLTLPKQQQLR